MSIMEVGCQAIGFLDEDGNDRTGAREDILAMQNLFPGIFEGPIDPRFDDELLKATVMNGIACSIGTEPSVDPALLYYAGHGISQDEAQKLYTRGVSGVPRSTSFDEYSDEIVAGTWVLWRPRLRHSLGYLSPLFLFNCAAQQKKNHLIIVSDSCFSGAWKDAYEIADARKKTKYFTIQAACSSTEGAVGGVFTPVFSWIQIKDNRSLVADSVISEISMKQSPLFWSNHPDVQEQLKTDDPFIEIKSASGKGIFFFKDASCFWKCYKLMKRTPSPRKTRHAELLDSWSAETEASQMHSQNS